MTETESRFVVVWSWGGSYRRTVINYEGRLVIDEIILKSDFSDGRS